MGRSKANGRIKQQAFEILLLLLKNAGQEIVMYIECYNTMNRNRILIHQLGVFETQQVISIFKDKIVLQK